MEGDDILERLQTESQDLRDKNTQLNTALSTSSYQGQEDPNLIQFQIDTGEMLEKLEHTLKGERKVVDAEGNEFWTKPTKMIQGEDGELIEVVDEESILLNDHGVNVIMSIIGTYIDKNTVLSFYDEMRINEILADIGDKVADFIHNTYEVIGMDTQFKKTRYEITVLTIIHSIENAYRRALRGKTMEDLNSSRIFTQLDNMGSKPGVQAKNKFNLFKPGTW